MCSEYMYLHPRPKRTGNIIKGNTESEQQGLHDQYLTITELKFRTWYRFTSRHGADVWAVAGWNLVIRVERLLHAYQPVLHVGDGQKLANYIT